MDKIFSSKKRDMLQKDGIVDGDDNDNTDNISYTKDIKGFMGDASISAINMRIQHQNEHDIMKMDFNTRMNILQEKLKAKLKDR